MVGPATERCEPPGCLVHTSPPIGKQLHQKGTSPKSSAGCIRPPAQKATRPPSRLAPPAPPAPPAPRTPALTATVPAGTPGPPGPASRAMRGGPTGSSAPHGAFRPPGPEESRLLYRGFVSSVPRSGGLASSGWSCQFRGYHGTWDLFLDLGGNQR